MKHFETLSQLQVNEAIQTGLERQAIHHALASDGKRPKEANMSNNSRFVASGRAKLGLLVVGAALAACATAGFLARLPAAGSSPAAVNAHASAIDPEIQRFVAYSQAQADLNRLDQRRSEIQR